MKLCDPTHWQWVRRHALGLLVGLCLVPVMAVEPAAAHFATTEYSRGSENCSSLDNLVDPVSLVFYGYGAYGETYGHSHRTFDLLDAISGWGDSDSSTQYAGSHSACTAMEREAANGCGDCTRYHIRLNQTHHQDLSGRFETVGTPHHEVERDCGHAVPPDGFNNGRGHVKYLWLLKYGESKLGNVQNWGNTRPMRQCDGQNAVSSGGVYWLITD